MFRKALETDQGENAEYFAPISIQFDPKSRIVEVSIGLWKNKNKYDAGKKPYQQKNYVLRNDSFPFSNARVTNILENIRDKIVLADSWFADAVVD